MVKPKVGSKKPAVAKSVVATPEPVVPEVAPVALPVVVNVVSPEKKVVFEGSEVLKKLTYGETATHYHCALADGTTKHVPKELFEQ